MKNLYRILGLSCAIGIMSFTNARAGTGICHINCTDGTSFDIAEPNKPACCAEFDAICHSYGMALFDGGGFPACPSAIPPQG